MPNVGISISPKMEGHDLFDLITGPIEHWTVLETALYACQGIVLTNAT